MYSHILSFTIIAVSLAGIWCITDALSSTNENTYRRTQNLLPYGSPVAQNSLIFKLPDELILHILSFISPLPQHSDHFARFRAQYNMIINDHHRKRVEFLRPLSMTCRTMRLRFTPWIWERLELLQRRNHTLLSEAELKLRMVLDVLTGDASLATTVNCLTIHFTLNGTLAPLFVGCLKALPNLHTLEIARSENRVMKEFRAALRGVKLPQIKTLIIPAAAHYLLKNCREVEDVVCVVKSWDAPSDEFLRSVALGSSSKIRRLAISLTGTECGKLTTLMLRCSQLRELTLIYPPPGFTEMTEDGLLSNTVEPARAAVSEIVDACLVLPNLDTLQIVHFFEGLFPFLPTLMRYRGHQRGGNAWFEREQTFKAGVKIVKDTAVEALRRRGRWEGGEGGRKRVTVKVVELDWVLEFDPECQSAQRTLGSVKVEEYEVE